MNRQSWLVPTLLWATGCGHEPPPATVPPPPLVRVSRPVQREVTDYEFFTGRTEASVRVELRARVTGYLERADFQEGDLVQQGDLLFLIDPKPYRAEVARAEAGLAQAQARQRRLDADFERAQTLYARKAISREEFDKLLGDRDDAHASCRVAEANLELARLNLRFTEIRAPFTGRISRRLVDPGNLVKADETLLTVLVVEEPMFAYFDVDERTLLRQLLHAGMLDAFRTTQVPVAIGLADEEDYPHPAVVNFVDNRLDPSTGSMWLRAQFVSPSRPIKPGMFIRVRFPLGEPYPALLVAEQAIGTDQGQKFLFVVGPDRKVTYRQVTVGRLQEDGLRVIHEGLQPGELVVVSGLQRVRAGTSVTPQEMSMPLLSRTRGRLAEPE